MSNQKLSSFSLAIIMAVSTSFGVSSCTTEFTPAPKANETMAISGTPESNQIVSTTASGGEGIPLPADPQPVEFISSDGAPLKGTYYPARFESAPLVVLMHWARGDQTDWEEIAYWLQNRGLSGTSSRSGSETWLDPSWFPELPDDIGYAVFTFTFRDCEGGCASFTRESWLLDAQAAMQEARNLPGVDPDRVAAIGASIGADGVVDACTQGCLGALSLSPGGYLTVPYDQAVTTLSDSDPPRKVWCLAAENDTPSAEACRKATGANYKAIIFAGNSHGLALLNPDIEPDSMRILLEFLESTIGS